MGVAAAMLSTTASTLSAQSPASVVASLPFDLVDNRVVVHATLNGMGPYALILDTGAEADVSKEMVSELHLSPTGHQEIYGVGEQTETADNVRLDDIGLGPVHLVAVDALASSFSDWVNVFGTYRIDGVLGYPLFTRYVVEIDYDRREVRLYDPATFAYHGPGASVPFEIDGLLPVVSGAVDGIAGSLGLDLGARSALILYGPFADHNHLRERYHVTAPVVNGWGVGGPVRAQVGRVGTLTLGSVTVRDLVARLSVQRSGATTSERRAGLVGPDVFSQFLVWFDYPHRRMILEPTASYGRHDIYDRSGMWLGQEGTDFVVLDVLPGGPAAAAGLTVGDHVVAVDGHPTVSLLLPTTRLRLRTDAPGTTVQLQVRRGGGDLATHTLVLRDLV